MGGCDPLNNQYLWAHAGGQVSTQKKKKAQKCKVTRSKYHAGSCSAAASCLPGTHAEAQLFLFVFIPHALCSHTQGKYDTVPCDPPEGWPYTEGLKEDCYSAGEKARQDQQMKQICLCTPTVRNGNKVSVRRRTRGLPGRAGRWGHRESRFPTCARSVLRSPRCGLHPITMFSNTSPAEQRGVWTPGNHV